MDTRWVMAFVAAVETGSLSGAARRLAVPLSTISRQLSDLEGDVGARLLERTGRGVRLTHGGERFLARARAALRELRLGTDEVKAGGGVSLRLAVAPDVALRVMPGVVVGLLARHPGLSLDLRADTRRVSLLEEGYDAAVRVGSLAPSELIATRVGAVTPCLCGPSELLDATWDDVMAVGLVGVHGVPGRLRSALGEAVEMPWENRLSVSTFAEAAELAALLRRPVVMPSWVAVPWLQSGRLVRLRASPSLPRVDVHLLRTPGHRGSAVIGDLATLLAEAVDAAERAVAG